MKKIGMIGGLSWRSTVRYYEIINNQVARRKGGLHSAPLLIESLDFAEVARCVTAEDWDCAAASLIASAKRHESAGTDAILICA
ncbi:MAG: aspartate/glutamate racemase family protein, partial [Sphingobium sp.]